MLWDARLKGIPFSRALINIHINKSKSGQGTCHNMLPLHFTQWRTQDFLKEGLRGRGQNQPTPNILFLLGFRPLHAEIRTKSEK